jgi:hypothetical protein
VVEAEHAPSGIYLVSRFIKSSLLIECWSLSLGWVWRGNCQQGPVQCCRDFIAQRHFIKEMIGLYLQHTALDSLKSIDLDVWGIGK